MEFALTEEQRLLDESLRGYLARELTLDRLKALAKDAGGYSDSHWRALADLGIAGLMVPEEHGGAVAGAVIGGVLGNQIGSGDGRKAATAVGAVAGGVAGAGRPG